MFVRGVGSLVVACLLFGLCRLLFVVCSWSVRRCVLVVACWLVFGVWLLVVWLSVVCGY